MAAGLQKDEYRQDLAIATFLTQSGADPYKQTGYLDTIWNYPGEDGNFYLALTFGADSSLIVNDGWDHVTGWGEPNGLPFIQGVTGKTTGASISK
jgi:hypothetical protein